MAEQTSPMAWFHQQRDKAARRGTPRKFCFGVRGISYAMQSPIDADGPWTVLQGWRHVGMAPTQAEALALACQDATARKDDGRQANPRDVVLYPVW
jgi:hypothetical protein